MEVDEKKSAAPEAGKRMVQQRETKQRRIVYEAVMAHWDHPTADEIYRTVRTTAPYVSKATVYRNLKVLVENGAIRHVKVPGMDRYDRTTDDHCHILCVICGKVIDSPIGYMAEADRIAEEKSGFRILRHRMVFEGVCPDCLAKEKS